MGALVFARAFRQHVTGVLTTSAAFGSLSLWGYTTKDLTGFGTFLIMAIGGDRFGRTSFMQRQLSFTIPVMLIQPGRVVRTV